MPENRSRLKSLFIDLLLFVLLAGIGFSVFSRKTHGDLWLDEANYATASLHSVNDNRHDKSDKPDQPELLIRLRHYHAPATALILKFAHRYGSAEETLRTPFVIAGALSVGTLYLCGLCLYGSRREIAFAVAALTIITPANIRMASHAIPWSFIILELLLQLLCALIWVNTRKPAALAGLGAALGLLFVTSETFFVALAALLLAVPLALLPELKAAWLLITKKGEPEGTREAREAVSRLLKGLGTGAAAFVLIGLLIWPHGLAGGCVTMLKHYVDMRHSESFAVNIGAVVYKVAPKWSYLYWYSKDYLPYFLCYAAGSVAALLMLVINLKKLAQAPPASGQQPLWYEAPAGIPVLICFTAVLLAAAHRAHIIGPEYLAHCLPFLDLCCGLVVLAISRVARGAGAVVLVLCGVYFLRWHPGKALPGMDARTQVSRWPLVCQVLKPRWNQPAGSNPDRLLLGPQSSTVAYWYLHEVANIPIHDWQIGQFPISGPGPAFLAKLRGGKYRYVVVSSQFEDNVINAVDERSLAILKTWEKVYQSDEKGMGQPRLTVFGWRPQAP
jgi:hypothetical protein